MDETPYTYFVSYSHGPGFGSTEIQRNEPIASWADVESATTEVTDHIRRAMPFYEVNTNDIVILNWILLSGPKEK